MQDRHIREIAQSGAKIARSIIILGLCILWSMFAYKHC